MERPTSIVSSVFGTVSDALVKKSEPAARAPREMRHDVSSSSVRADHDDVPMPAEQQPQFTDTILFQSPIIDVNEAWLEQQRVLTAGARGPLGAPYKMLRTQVLRRMEQLNATTLAVMSPTAGAGKTLTAINLAIAIAAEQGRTVLLVDFDLRNPSIHQRFGFQPELGIEDCLHANRPIQEAMVKLRGYERLTVLPARARVESSSEVLADSRTATLVTEMKSRYANRVLIFDVPPVLQADDALAFTKNIQAGLVVVNEGATKREDVTRTIELLRDTKIVGTVLNGAREPTQTYY